MAIKQYKPVHQKALIKILRLNTPQYFDTSEEQDFIDYLENELESYFVLEKEDKVVGAGGINYFEDHARISWDMVHPDYKGQGIGKQLTKHRIAEIRQSPQMKYIIVRTSQLVYPFYQKLGFTLEEVKKDFWAKGFDLYQMRMEI